MTSALFNRTVKTNIILYKPNGNGRDAYIIHDNAGFWKNSAKPISQKAVFTRTPFLVYHSLRRIPPIWTYHSDGSGRDSYVCINNGGLIKKFRSMAENVNNFLRNKDDERKEESVRNKRYKLTKDEKLYFRKINKIQKDVIDRLYNSINHNKKNILRKRLIGNDKYKLIDESNSYENNNNINNNNNSKNIKWKNHSISFRSKGGNNPIKLEPIQCKNNSRYYNYSSLLKNKHNLLLNNKHMTSNSTGNIFRKKINLNGEYNSNRNYYKRKFVYDSFDKKLTSYPKVKCLADSGEY